MNFSAFASALLCTGLLLTLAFQGSVRAALPPSEYSRMQDEAQEALQIQTLRVQEESDGDGGIVVRITAFVEEVTRSASDLEVGSPIQIVYPIPAGTNLRTDPMTVEAPPPGQSSPAFLNKDPDSPNYSPAAGRMSFLKFETPGE